MRSPLHRATRAAGYHEQAASQDSSALAAKVSCHAASTAVPAGRVPPRLVTISQQPAGPKHFYVHVLGWDLLSDEGYELAEGTRLRWLEVRPHGGQTAVTLVLEDDTMKAGMMKGLILRASSLDSTIAALASRGLTTEKIQETPWARHASFYDPDGNTWIIQEIRNR